MVGGGCMARGVHGWGACMAGGGVHGRGVCVLGGGGACMTCMLPRTDTTATSCGQ